MINKKDKSQITIDEVHEIMFILRGSNARSDGDYRSQHLGTVLSYLKAQDTEDKRITLSKLCLILGMAQRQVKENYFDGLLNFGIISVDEKCERWKWIGSKAIKNMYGQLRKNTPEDNEFVVESLQEHVKNNPKKLSQEEWKNLPKKDSKK
jgi:hypothetical protein